MASTVGHALAGIALVQAVDDDVRRPWARPAALAAGAVLANLPDIDFLVGYVLHGDPRAAHSGFTHTVPFALLAAGVVAGTRLFGRPRRTFGIAFLLVLSHVLMDFMAGKSLGFAPGHGVMLLYPLSETRLSAPFKLLIGTQHRDLPGLVSAHNAVAVLWEVVCLGPLLWLVTRWRRPARSSTRV